MHDLDGNKSFGSVKTATLFLVLFSLVYFAVYYPIVVFQILTADDFNYYFFWNSVKSTYPTCFVIDAKHWLPDVSLLIGRPLANPFHCISARGIANLSNYPLMRSVSVILLVIISTAYAIKLNKYLNKDKWQAFLLSFAVFSLPGMTFYVTYYSFSISWLMAFLFTIMGAEFIERVNVSQISVRSIFTFKNGVLAFSGVLCLIVSLLIYQLATMFFIPYIAGRIMFGKYGDWKNTKIYAATQLTVFIFSLAVYFAFYKLILLPYYVETHQISANALNSAMAQYQFSLSHNLLEKYNMLEYLTVVSLSLWNMFPDRNIALLVTITISVGALIPLVRPLIDRNGEQKRPYYRYLLEKGGVLIGLLLLANAPSILASGNMVNSRMAFSFSAFITLLLFSSIIQASLLYKSKPYLIFYGIFSLIAAGSFFINSDRVLRFITVNHLLENRFIQYEIGKNIENGNIKLEKGIVNNIHMIKVPWKDTFLGLPFGLSDEIYSVSAREDKLPGLIHFNLMQMGLRINDVSMLNDGITKNPGKDQFQFYVSASTKFIDKETIEAATVIDMTELMPYEIHFTNKEARGTKVQNTIHQINSKDIIITASSSGTGHIAPRAFDGSTESDDFWEAGGFPQWLLIEYPDTKQINRYEMYSGYTSEKSMPRSWVLYGSNDGKKWKKIDSRDNEVNWQIFEKREYNIEPSRGYRYYKYYFTSANGSEAIRIYEILMKGISE